MPTYNFKCPACGTTGVADMSMELIEAYLMRCSICGTYMNRVYDMPAVQIGKSATDVFNEGAAGEIEAPGMTKEQTRTALNKMAKANKKCPKRDRNRKETSAPTTVHMGVKRDR